jgi:hypothetical protein
MTGVGILPAAITRQARCQPDNAILIVKDSYSPVKWLAIRQFIFSLA